MIILRPITNTKSKLTKHFREKRNINMHDIQRIA